MNRAKENLYRAGRQRQGLRRGVLPLCLVLMLGGCDFYDEAAVEQPPEVALMRPGDGAVIAGTNVLVHVAAEAFGADNHIAFINVNLNGERVGEAEQVSGRFLFRWNTFEVPDGTYRLEAVAFDRHQARGLSAPLQVVVANRSAGKGPNTAILSPASGETVSGKVRVVARKQADQPAITRVDFLIDGVVLYSDEQVSGDTFTYAWDTQGELAGLHTLEVKAYSQPGVFRLSEATGVMLLPVR